MPNVVLSVVPATSPVTSGAATPFTVSYQSTSSGSVEFRSSAPFTVSPTSAKLPASPAAVGALPVKLTITRTDPLGPKQCDLIATFFASRVHALFEVS